MIITRAWAMPNKETFKIKPIKEILSRYVGDGRGWLDPFSGKNSPAEFTNDLNPEIPSRYHMKALDFCTAIKGQHPGILFDPPYSLRQTKECYNGVGLKLSYEESLHASFDREKNVIAPKIKPMGYAVSFGWSTNGFGINRGFEILEILLVPHGGHHNDTIVTVERKRNLNER